MTDGTEPSEAHGQAVTANWTIWYNGDIKKNGSTWIQTISQLYQTEGYLTSSTDELNDKQRKNKEKSQNGLCNNLGSNNVGPRWEFRVWHLKKTPYEI